jgi:hypothetical protein
MKYKISYRWAKTVSVMCTLFDEAYVESGCDRITYLGQPMVYDGALFVTREGF